MNSSSSQSHHQPCILWSFVARNDVILADAEAGVILEDDKLRSCISETAQKLVAKKPTPGWEFVTLKKVGRKCPFKLKGMKFHIYDHTADGDFHIWSVGCIFDANAVDTQQVQSFIEKIVGISEMFREHDTWKYGGAFAAQEQFSPMLSQRMEEIAYLGKYAMVNSQLNNLKETMSRNIDMILEREEKIENLQDRSEKLNEMSAVFKKRTKSLKKQMLWQNAKHGLVLGTAITAGVAVIVVPPIVAAL